MAAPFHTTGNHEPNVERTRSDGYTPARLEPIDENGFTEAEQAELDEAIQEVDEKTAANKVLTFATAAEAEQYFEKTGENPDDYVLGFTDVKEMHTYLNRGL